MGKVTSAFLFAMLSIGALGHMEMVNPLPIRSPEDPKATNPDYDYVSPLDASGSNFPCKGYHTDPFRATADYQAGQSYTMEIEGGATHEGGSCQLSLSYDNGESFQVIKSMIGGCPLQSSYDFTIPSDAPSGEALFAWTWFNKVGNREMYMNCAFVTISGSSSKVRARQETSSFDSAPSIFIANVNGPGQCTTIEGEDVVFPYPGDDVEGAQDAGEGYKCSGTAPGAPDGDSPDPPSPPTDPAPVPTSEPTQAPTLPPSTTTMVTYPSPPSSTPVPTPTPGQPGQCTEGETVCNSPTTWSLCSGGRLVFMGPVAPGMTCDGGSINRAPY